MDTDDNPLLKRIRDGLSWPSWNGWTDTPAPPLPDVHRSRIDHESRGVGVRRRLSLAKTIDQGGPYTEVFRTAAMERTQAEHGTDLGPLASFTMAIKDLIAIEGRIMNAGSAVRADAAPETQTAPIVLQLEALGAVSVGMVSLHEFAFGVTGVNDFAGTAPNPRAPDRVPGGSSSGSASAVADGSARIAIGTDTGGSVRIPASFCDVVGFKPSVDTYPSAGVFPLSGTLDHVGLFANNVADIVTVHTALGHSAADARLPTKVGVARADIDAADPEVQERCTAAIAALAEAGCEIVDVAWPDAEKAFVTSTTIMFSEAAAIHAAALDAHGDRYGDDIRVRLELGAALTSVEVATAHEYRRQLIAEVALLLQSVDVIVGPTTPMVAPLLSEAADPALAPRVVANTRLGNVLGLPGISLPLPAGTAPVGLQIFGATNADLLGSASAIEAAIGEAPHES